MFERVWGNSSVQSAFHTMDIPEDKPRTGTAPTIIGTLAPELLAEIFRNYLPHDRCSIRRQSQTPLLLGRVCRRWRYICYSSPELWCRFAVGEDQFSQVDCKKDLEATRHWISRSGTQPLSIRIHYHRYYSNGAMLPQLLQSIASQSWRWKEMEIKVHHDSEFESILIAPFHTGNLPRLEKFISTTLGVASTALDSVILSSAPRLKVLRHSLGMIHFDFGGGRHDIRDVDLLCSEDPKTSLQYLYICFTFCPSLTRLAISVRDSETSLLQELPPIIELSQLRHFSLSLHAHIDPWRLFDILFLPALEVLEFSMDVPFSDDTDWPHLRTMLARSRPPLESLSLTRIPLTEATLAECLLLTPSLFDFVISGIKCTDATLHSFTVHEANTSKTLCPSLYYVDFGDISSFSPDAMIGMILSRRPSQKSTGISKENCLSVVKCTHFSFESICSDPDIAECLKDGLTLLTDEL